MSTSADRNQLLSILLRERGLASDNAGAIPRRDHPADPAPLSFPQRRLWFLGQLDPLGTSYNVPYAFRIVGPLHMEALRDALAELLHRHHVLRTRFSMAEGQPRQVVGEISSIVLEIVDVSAPTEKLEDEYARLVRERAYTPFDLERGPLMRAFLLRRHSDDHVFVFVAHHIVFDGWSAAILFRELGELYSAVSAGREARLPPLPLQYADYAAWQTKADQEQKFQADLEWWKARLQGAPATVHLPVDHPRPAKLSVCTGKELSLVPVALRQQLEQIATRRHATLFMVLLAAYKLLIHKYTGATHLVTGTAVANRSRRELEPLIGFFVNTLALPVHIRPEMSFSQWLDKVRETVLGAYERQDTPFERLVQEIQPERDLSHNPIFQSMLILQNTPHQVFRLDELQAEPMDTDYDAAKFDLELHFVEQAQGLQEYLLYNRDIFEPVTAQRLLKHLNTVLQTVCSNPGALIKDISVLTAAERHQIVAEWGTNAAEAPARCVHEMFETQAASDPERVAIQAVSRITYAELNALANQIARGLRAQNYPPQTCIALLAEQTPATVACILGIAKAGYAFTVLDPGYPVSRLQQVVAEARPAMVVCEPATQLLACSLAGNQELASAVSFKIAMIPELSAGREKTDLRIAVDLGSRAYVVFTSGSTGRPKGIVQTHRGLAQYVQWQGAELGHGPADRIANWASLAYDASYCELFGSLCFGGTMHMTTRTVRHDPKALLAWIEQERISVLQLPPNFCRQMLRQFTGATDLSSLRTLLLVGEVFPPDLARECLKKTKARVYNLYGPTECILTGFQLVETAVLDRWHSVPIGRPIRGRQLLVLDADENVTPIGVIGEVFIRSEYLTEGYLGRPEETARAFPSNQWSDGQNRLYRTGDLARWLPGGALEFHGRRDTQVKLRGIRLELEEIESILMRHPAIFECAVAVCGENDDQRLHAFYVPKPGPSPAAHELHTFLKRQLPASIIPSRFISLPDLPRTASRKIDRKKLASCVPEAEEVAPQQRPYTPTEQHVADVWKTVLNVSEVGLDVNFFVLGGHSLLATQAINLLSQVSGVELTVRSLFENPTVAGMARVIEDVRAERSRSVERLTEQIGRLTPDEVRRLLNQA
jgi:amino acid adenylation domain-containing protein